MPNKIVRDRIILSSAPAVDPLRRDLVAYWRLDEASGTRYDAVGTSHLSQTNGVGQADGKLGKAASFVAANSQYLSCADNTALSMGDIDFTIAAWAYLDSGGVSRAILCKGPDVAANAQEFSVWVGLDYRPVFTVANNINQTGCISPTILSLSEWFLIVAWHDSINNQTVIQVNNGTPTTASRTGGSWDSGASFRIGTDSNRHIDGRIDNVSLWKRILTADERTSLYNSGAGREIRL